MPALCAEEFVQLRVCIPPPQTEGFSVTDLHKPFRAASPAPQPEPSRRRFIKLAGGGAVLAAIPFAGCSSGYPDVAVKAWQPIGETTDVRRWMLAHALLAPNPHNRQPWIADLRREGEITLALDGDRLLPQTDPFGRQIVIGCGAFVELAVIAAAEKGFRVSVNSFPAGEPSTSELPGNRVLATLKLTADSTMPRDALFAQIRRRHTNKTAYDNQRAIPAEVWQKMQSAAAGTDLLMGAVTDAAQMAQVRKLTRDSYYAEMTTARTYLETANLMRIGGSEIERHRDGVSIIGTMPQLMSAIGMFNRFEVPKEGSANLKRMMDRWEAFETGSGYLWLASRGNGRKTQLDSGRAYVRAHLLATAAGVDMHPLSQALQEFAEVKPQYDGLHKLLGFDPATTTVQMFSRVGYGVAPVGGTPRRELDDIVIEARKRSQEKQMQGHRPDNPELTPVRRG
jgi:hypothetical protein